MAIDRRSFLKGTVLTAGAGAVAGLADAKTAGAAAPAIVPNMPLAQPPHNGDSTPGRNYPKVGGNLANHNYSSLSRVNRRNVTRLGGAWQIQLEGGQTTFNGQQGTIVAENGTLYVHTTQQNVFAIDGRNGQIKWKTNIGDQQTNMRGVGLGGGLVYSISGANVVYALDQRTGRIVWQKQLLTEDVGSGQGCDPTQGECGGGKGTLAGAIVYWDGLIFVGMQGSTIGARGRAYALDSATGEIAWTFWSAPGTGQFGNDTWEGDSWQTGGAVCWIHPAVDPDLGLVYWTFGNPYPRLDGSTRGGNNLFANSIVALDARTGVRRWHFQSVHHDIWDYDNVMSPVLLDLKVNGQGRTRKVVVYGSKVSMYYILDRETGECVHGIEERPVPQEEHQKTSPTQPFPGGEPFVHSAPRIDDATRPVPFYQTGPLFTPFWDRATVLFPGAGGGADWSYPSFSPHTGLVYVGYGLINSGYSNGDDGRINTSRPLGEYFAGGIAAVDPRSNTVAWRKEGEWSLAHGNAILSTAGRVLFQGRPDGILTALDDTTGEELWSFQCGAGVHTSPVTYEVDGEQYLAVYAGGSWLPYPDIPKGDNLWAFKLGGRVAPAPTPTPPSTRNEIRGAPVPGSSVDNTVVLGRIWDSQNNRPGTTENLVAQNAMSPQSLTVPAGTTVTFLNPADNVSSHGAVSFFESEFDSGTLMPGQSYQHTFAGAGEFFYNDPGYPQNTGKVVVS